jgi:hypothetical protein
MGRRRKVNATGRNTGDSWAGAPRILLESAAWRSLSRAALLTYWEVRRRYVGDNNGKIPFSLAEAVRLFRISKTTAVEAFAELEVKGLMVRTRKGSFKTGLATEWAFTDKGWSGHLRTDAWRHWKPEAQARKPVHTEYPVGTRAVP